jgi:predicted nucleotidyltransferase component of viral defense system
MGRVRARDCYDVYRLLEQESFDDPEIAAALREKARAHEVELDLAPRLPDDDVEAVRAYWERTLKRLVTKQLPFETVVERIDTYLHHLATVDG